VQQDIGTLYRMIRDKTKWTHFLKYVKYVAHKAEEK